MYIIYIRALESATRDSLSLSLSLSLYIYIYTHTQDTAYVFVYTRYSSIKYSFRSTLISARVTALCVIRKYVFFLVFCIPDDSSSCAGQVGDNIK